MTCRGATAVGCLALALGLGQPLLAQRDHGHGGRPADRASTPPPAQTPAAVPPGPYRSNLVGGGLPARPGVDAFRAGPDTYGVPWSGASPSGSAWSTRPRHRTDAQAPQWSRAPRGGRNLAGAVLSYPVGVGGYFVPYGPYYDGSTGAPTGTGSAGTVSSAIPEPAVGFLRLAVTPRTARVIVDGAYEGVVDDFGGSGERTVVAGVHRVRLEAEGYSPVTFDVRVPANDTITLRRDLSEESPPPPAGAPGAQAPAGPVTPASPKVIYVIPRCYLGDTLPVQAQLPAGCSVADLRTLP